MKTTKCYQCNRRFINKDWHKGVEKFWCFTCIVYFNFLTSTLLSGKLTSVDKYFELTPREVKVLKYRFGVNNGIMHTLEETGKEFGVTRERIRQIQSRGIDIILRFIEKAKIKLPKKCLNKLLKPLFCEMGLDTVL